MNVCPLGRLVSVLPYIAYTRPPVFSLSITVRQPDRVVGRTHASSVIPAVRSSEFESATVTMLSTPLKDSAPPNLPPVERVAPVIVPGLLEPELSVAVVPDSSSKPSAVTRPVGGGGAVFDTVTATVVDVVVLPPASRATAVRLWLPLPIVVVSHV